MLNERALHRFRQGFGPVDQISAFPDLVERFPNLQADWARDVSESVRRLIDFSQSRTGNPIITDPQNRLVLGLTAGGMVEKRLNEALEGEQERIADRSQDPLSRISKGMVVAINLDLRYGSLLAFRLLIAATIDTPSPSSEALNGILRDLKAQTDERPTTDRINRYIARNKAGLNAVAREVEEDFTGDLALRTFAERLRGETTDSHGATYPFQTRSSVIVGVEIALKALSYNISKMNPARGQ